MSPRVGLGLLGLGPGLPLRLGWNPLSWGVSSLLSGLPLWRCSSCLSRAPLAGSVLGLGTLLELWRLTALPGLLLLPR